MLPGRHAQGPVTVSIFCHDPTNATAKHVRVQRKHVLVSYVESKVAIDLEEGVFACVVVGGGVGIGMGESSFIPVGRRDADQGTRPQLNLVCATAHVVNSFLAWMTFYRLTQLPARVRVLSW